VTHIPSFYIATDPGNRFILDAKNCAETMSLDLKQKVGVVLVHRGHFVIGRGANGSQFHADNGCERKRLGCKTGEGYELCEGCQPHNHAEPSAIESAINGGHRDFLNGAEAFMWGHYYCCSPCVLALRNVGISRVHLPIGAEEMFK
jgi:deoxycytidylate deaminase